MACGGLARIRRPLGLAIALDGGAVRRYFRKLLGLRLQLSETARECTEVAGRPIQT